MYPVEKFEGISRASNSYCRATCTAYLQKVTSSILAYFGFTPAMPAMRKYVDVRSNLSDQSKKIV
jgi:hypothetical protein